MSEELKIAEKAMEDAFPTNFVHIKDIPLETLQISPLLTGFKFLDDSLFLKKARPQIVVIGARPGQGKSALLLQIAANVAMNNHVAFFSLEMDKEDLKSRLLAPRIGRPVEDIMFGKVKPRDFEKGEQELEKMNLEVSLDFKRSINHIAQETFSLNKKRKLDLVVIDYLQKMTGPAKQSRTYELEEILGQIKELLGQVNIPIMLGAQVNRNCEYRGKSSGDYVPILADLKDSGSIEQDADTVLFISRQEVYDGSRKGEADFYIAKNRHGKTGKKTVQFKSDYCEFKDSPAIIPRKI